MAYVVAAPGNVVADSTARAAIAAASVQSQSKSSESAAGGKVWRQVWRPPQPQISAATAQYNLLSSTKSCKTQLTPRDQPNSSQVQPAPVFVARCCHSPLNIIPYTYLLCLLNIQQPGIG